MKPLKKTVCLLLVVLLAAAAQLLCFAQSAPTRLTFDQNGDFTILHLTDWHCDYPLPTLHRQLVLESLAAAKPEESAEKTRKTAVGGGAGAAAQYAGEQKRGNET